jgi:hypothetical protein
MKNNLIIFKLITGTITFLLVLWIMTRPNIYKPFSDKTAWEEGFKLGYGEYPDSALIAIHNKYK